MKRIIFVFSLVLLFTGYAKQAAAQYYFYNDSYYDSPILFEIGGSAGAMNCLTDLGGKRGIGKKFIKDLNTGKTEFSGGLYVTAMYKYAIGLRLEGTFGKVSADDNVLKNVDVKDIARARYNRNLSFRSSISEFSLMAELHPLFILIDWSERDEDPPRYSPYLLGGVGYYSFNPQTKLGNKWVDLQPLHTEGQGFVEYPDRLDYKLKQMNFPVGLGIKYDLSDAVNVKGEFVYRVLRTDYLDDVSTTYIDPAAFANPANGMAATTQATAFKLSDRQLNKVTGPGGKRGSPAQKDAYFTFNLKLGLTIGRERIR
jgi:opacity protein-like surface antigen